MAGFNKPLDPRSELKEVLDAIIASSPRDICAPALKEAIPTLSDAQIEKILERLDEEIRPYRTGVPPIGGGESIPFTPRTVTHPDVDSLSPQVRRHVKTLAESPDPRLRMESAKFLGESGDHLVIPSLNDALYDENPYVQTSVAKALFALGNDSGIPVLIEGLESPESEVRREMAKALGELKIASATAPLIAGLKDESVDVRRNCAWALSQTKDRGAISGLVGALSDESEHVRANAARALGELGDKQALEGLRARLPVLGIFGRERNGDVRKLIREAIRKIEGA